MRAGKLVCGILTVAVLAGGCGKKDRDLTTDLHRAAAGGDLAEVQRLIVHGANLNARDSMGRTPLLLAAEQGYAEVVAVLVRCGAQIDCKDRAGLTPVVLAMRRNHRAAVACLVHEGATADLPIASYLGDVARVKSLVQGGANVNARDEDKGKDAGSAHFRCLQMQRSSI